VHCPRATAGRCSPTTSLSATRRLRDDAQLRTVTTLARMSVPDPTSTVLAARARVE